MLIVTNYIFTVIFLLEMIFKLIGLGFKVYVKDGFNLFDAFVVFVSLIEISLSLAGTSGASGLTVFRTFRLFRVFKLIRSWKSLRALMITIINSLAKVSTAAVLLLIVMLFYCLECNYLPGFSRKKTSTAKNLGLFDNFWWGFVTVFQVLTGENWNEVLYDGMKVAGLIILFFLLLTFIGNDFQFVFSYFVRSI